MSYFKNKVAWVTGATSGIGEHLVYAMAQAGAKIAISSRRASELERVQAACPKPEDILIIPLDVTQIETFPQVSEKVWNHFGQIDILVLNAGISQRSLAKETQIDVDQRLMAVNYFGVIGLAKAVLPYMLKQQSGQMVVTSSVMGKVGTPMRSAYAASKHALHGFFDSLRAELKDDNIAVTIICPGYVRTEISINALTSDGSKHKKMSPGNANGYTPKEFAAKAMKVIAKRKEEVYIGGKEIMAIYLKRYLPRLWSYVVTRIQVT